MQQPIVLSLLSFLVASAACADPWPRFRGPNGSGVAPAVDVPNEWTESDFAWRVDLPGVGHSSPVVWGDLVFVTSGDAESDSLQLEAYHVATGKRAWRETLAAGPFEMHASNSLASSTPALDNQRVYVSLYGANGASLVAFTHAGQQVWRRELGEFSSTHGFAASPVVVGDLVCIQGDTADGGYLVAIAADSGQEKWRAERAAGKESYATPSVVQPPGGRATIVTASMTGGIEGIDPATGTQLWQAADALPARTVSSPFVANDRVFAACGGGGNGIQLVALEISSDSLATPAYTLTKNVPYVPTGIVAGDLLFLWHERGTLTCIELATGEPLWTKRVSGKYYSSPILLGDRLLSISIEGEAVMVSAGREFRELGRTQLAEACQATPAVADGRLFVRTESTLMCLE